MDLPSIIDELPELLPSRPTQLGSSVDVPGSVWITIWVCLAIVVLTAGVVR